LHLSNATHPADGCGYRGPTERPILSFVKNGGATARYTASTAPLSLSATLQPASSPARTGGRTAACTARTARPSSNAILRPESSPVRNGGSRRILRRRRQPPSPPLPASRRSRPTAFLATTIPCWLGLKPSGNCVDELYSAPSRSGLAPLKSWPLPSRSGLAPLKSWPLPSRSGARPRQVWPPATW
jgi:hypothetical protein